jgi:hypothetical protein
VRGYDDGYDCNDRYLVYVNVFFLVGSMGGKAGIPFGQANGAALSVSEGSSERCWSAGQLLSSRLCCLNFYTLIASCRPASFLSSVHLTLAARSERDGFGFCYPELSRA